MSNKLQYCVTKRLLKIIYLFSFNIDIVLIFRLIDITKINFIY